MAYSALPFTLFLYGSLKCTQVVVTYVSTLAIVGKAFWSWHNCFQPYLQTLFEALEEPNTEHVSCDVSFCKECSSGGWLDAAVPQQR